MKILREDWIFNIADFGRRLEAAARIRHPHAVGRASWLVLVARPSGCVPSLRGDGQVGRNVPPRAGPGGRYTCGSRSGMISFSGGDL